MGKSALKEPFSIALLILAKRRFLIFFLKNHFHLIVPNNTSMYLKGEKWHFYINNKRYIYMFQNNEQDNTIRNAIWDNRSRNIGFIS